MVHFDAKLTGRVEDVSLADLLQLFHYGRKSVAVHVSGYLGGLVVMVDGEIRHAQCLEQQGEDALAALLAQKLVRVRTSPVSAPYPCTVQRSFGAVVLDLLRRNDEYERDTGDLPVPEQVTDSRLISSLERLLSEWLADRPDIEHGALIEPRDHLVLACDSPELWRNLVQSLLLQTLVAPYFDESFDEIDAFLPIVADTETDRWQTVVTFGGRRYVLSRESTYGWVAILVFRAAQVSHGLSLTHMVGLQGAVRHWVHRFGSGARMLSWRAGRSPFQRRRTD